GGVVASPPGAGRASVRAALLRRGCHELASLVDPRGIRLSGLAIEGQLDLAGLRVPFPLSFEDCEFDAAPVVEGADLAGLALTGCPRLPGLLGNGLRVRRDLDLSRSRVTGAHSTSASTSQTAAIWLCESDIGGRLLCLDTVIDGGGGRALQADRIHVRGAVRLLHQFTARGTIRLVGARIDGSLDLVGGQLDCPDGTALELGGAAIEGTVFLINDPGGRAPEVRGRIDMGGTRIAGQLLIRDATLEDRGTRPSDRGYARSSAPGSAISAPRLSVGAEVVLEGRCQVTGSVDLSMSDVSGVAIGEYCVLTAPGRTALDLTNAELRANLRLHEGARVSGTVRLAGATIHGTLAMHAALSDPERRSIVGATALVVDGDADLTRLRTTGGRVNLRGATLGSLTARGAQLRNPGGYSLSLNQALVKGSVRLVNGFSSAGLVVLNRAAIEGSLQLTGGSFACPGPGPQNQHGHAIEAISASVRGGIDLGWSAVSPSVDFTDATTTFLADDPAAWPAGFIIAGLSYDRFEKPLGIPVQRIWDQAARSAWLDRQTSYDSGPYEQAARVFRQHGYASEAEDILMAQRRRARQVAHSRRMRPLRILDSVYGFGIGYGYRPWRVMWALTVLLVLLIISLELPASQATLRANDGNGDVYTTRGLAFSPAGAARPAPVQAQGAPPGHAAPPDSCGDGEVRCFSPVLYAIDTVIPLISLDQRSTWYPDPHVRGGTLILWWLNLATLLGWLFSSIFALSLARLARGS
ncbi:MAG TPA: hypothetical protein VH637_25075, partial [Streptosporangiaceae bacterium]